MRLATNLLSFRRTPPEGSKAILAFNKLEYFRAALIRTQHSQAGSLTWHNYNMLSDTLNPGLIV